jgi:hypothetical protein
MICMLGEQAKALEGRAAELDQLRIELRAALQHATPIRAKTILQAMIDGIRVHAVQDGVAPLADEIALAARAVVQRDGKMRLRCNAVPRCFVPYKFPAAGGYGPWVAERHCKAKRGD